MVELLFYLSAAIPVDAVSQQLDGRDRVLISLNMRPKAKHQQVGQQVGLNTAPNEPSQQQLQPTKPMRTSTDASGLFPVTRSASIPELTCCDLNSSSSGSSSSSGGGGSSGSGGSGLSKQELPGPTLPPNGTLPPESSSAYSPEVAAALEQDSQDSEKDGTPQPDMSMIYDDMSILAGTRVELITAVQPMILSCEQRYCLQAMCTC